MKKRYERQISFKTLYLAFVRRLDLVFFTIIVSFVVSALASFVIIKQKYYSTFSFERYDSVIKETLYSKIKTYVLSDNTLETTAKELEKNKIYHADGSLITKEEIEYGVEVKDLEINSTIVEIEFSSTDKTIPQKVAETISYVTIDCINVGDDSTVKGTKVRDKATETAKDNKNIKTLLVGTASGVALAVIMAFLTEIYLDEVFDCDDVEVLGGRALETKLLSEKEQKIQFTLLSDKKKYLQKNKNDVLKFANQGPVYDDLVNLQNELTAIYGAKTICITSIDEPLLSSVFTEMLSNVYCLNNKHTAIFDFDSHDSKISEVIENESIKAKVGASKEIDSLFNDVVLNESKTLIIPKKQEYQCEFFDSSDFNSKLKKINDEYQKTIILASSINKYSDAIVLSKKVDCVLIVVFKNSSPKESIFKTIEKLNSEGVTNFAFIIAK